MELLKSWGFTHVLACRDSAPWQSEIELGHKYGLKMIVRWPNWEQLGCLGESMAFRCAEGIHNATGNPLVSGPSCWNPESEDRALEALPEILDEGWDGVLVHVLTGDRPFPTAWHLTSRVDLTSVYWSFDRWAQKAWGSLRNAIPMPDKPDQLRDLEFYRWYQDGWFRRLGVFTAAALERVNSVWTWFVPKNWWEKETMADGTADSAPQMEKWRQGVLKSGGDPVVVVAHLFGMGSSWQGRAEKTMRECHADCQWTSIVGAETVTAGEAVQVLRRNGPLARRLGFSGLLASDAHLYAEKEALCQAEFW
jgi:hypothetical protein